VAAFVGIFVSGVATCLVAAAATTTTTTAATTSVLGLLGLSAFTCRSRSVASGLLYGGGGGGESFREREVALSDQRRLCGPFFDVKVVVEV